MTKDYRLSNDCRASWEGRRRSNDGKRMNEILGVVVVGASGRMGQMSIRMVEKDERFRLVGAIEREGHPWLHSDIGISMGGTSVGVMVTSDFTEVTADTQAIIDFSTPAASVALARISAQTRVVHVIGTTGFSKVELAALAEAARQTVIVRAGNMSLGVNLLVKLTQQVAAALDDDYDIEIIEAHHNQKVDAPSGTALMLGAAAADGRKVSLSRVSDADRSGGMSGPRKRGTIGFATVRGGDIVGEHEVIFAGVGERLVLRHVATDRDVFVRGALRAARWGQDKVPGEYTMLDVLGL